MTPGTHPSKLTDPYGPFAHRWIPPRQHWWHVQVRPLRCPPETGMGTFLYGLACPWPRNRWPGRSQNPEVSNTLHWSCTGVVSLCNVQLAANCLSPSAAHIRLGSTAICCITIQEFEVRPVDQINRATSFALWGWSYDRFFNAPFFDISFLSAGWDQAPDSDQRWRCAW